jgi:putative addiction module killer protein
MAREIRPKEIVIYADDTGKEPFTDWLNKLRDPQTKRRIQTRLFRVESGNYGDCKSLKDGIFELRFTQGSGYRVYFGEDGEKIVVLLLGGDKSVQNQDIKQAKAYWKEYLSHA